MQLYHYLNGSEQKNKRHISILSDNFFLVLLRDKTFTQFAVCNIASAG